MEINIENFINNINESLRLNIFIKISLGDYHGSDPDLKNIYVKMIKIKNELKLSFTYRYKTKDIVKNYTFHEAISILEEAILIDGFRQGLLCTLKQDFLLKYDKSWKIKTNKPSHDILLSLDHDQQKNRKINPVAKSYLHALKITDNNGVVYKASQDKFRQINHFIEILSTVLNELPVRETTKIVDMGAGKGYLTFALYDYINNELKKKAEVIGLEMRKELVDLSNSIAQRSGFQNLRFVHGTIESFENTEMHVLMALHACDTATDDAIYKGITNNADLIIVAPCCHKQIRREIEKNKTKNNLDFILKHGIFLERQAEMVTDGLRALILDYFGYATKVFEFISDSHTPKNVLILGVKRPNKIVDKKSILEKIRNVKAYFGIEYHHLERILGLE